MKYKTKCKILDIIGYTIILMAILVIPVSMLIKIHLDNKRFPPEYRVHWTELSNKNAVVYEKKLKQGYNGYYIDFKVKINDSIKIVECTPGELYDAYNVGDTIKYIGMKYE